MKFPDFKFFYIIFLFNFNVYCTVQCIQYKQHGLLIITFCKPCDHVEGCPINWPFWVYFLQADKGVELTPTPRGQEYHPVHNQLAVKKSKLLNLSWTDMAQFWRPSSRVYVQKAKLFRFKCDLDLQLHCAWWTNMFWPGCYPCRGRTHPPLVISIKYPG